MSGAVDDAEHTKALFGAFAQSFSKKVNPERRSKAEARATMSEAAVRGRAPPKVQLGVRITADARDLLDELAKHHRMAIGTIVELAIETLAKHSSGFKKADKQ